MFKIKKKHLKSRKFIISKSRARELTLSDTMEKTAFSEKESKDDYNF